MAPSDHSDRRLRPGSKGVFTARQESMTVDLRCCDKNSVVQAKAVRALAQIRHKRAGARKKLHLDREHPIREARLDIFNRFPLCGGARGHTRLRDRLGNVG